MISIASTNILPTKQYLLPIIPLLPIEWYAKLAQELSCTLEWHLLNGITSLQIQSGLVSKYGKQAITSVEQSYVSENSIRQAFASHNRKVAIMSYLSMPNKDDSLLRMVRLRQILGREIDATLYPPVLISHIDPTIIGFKQMLFQPTAELVKQHRGIAGMIDALIVDGRFTGITADMYHLRRDSGPLADWKQSLKKMLPFIRRVHIGLGRERLGNVFVNSQSELNDMIYGNGQANETGQMIHYLVHDLGYKGSWTLEIPNWNFSSVSAAVNAHKRIIGNIYRLAEH